MGTFLFLFIFLPLAVVVLVVYAVLSSQKQCPFCKKMILKSATKCRFCHEWQPVKSKK